MAVLVTGGCGFIGSHIVDQLAEKNVDVVILDNLSSGSKENIKADDFPVYVMDLLDPRIEEIFRHHSIHTIIHQAAQASVPQSIRSPYEDGAVNIGGTIRLVELAKKYEAKKMVFASSSAVYGTPLFLPIPSDHAANPLSPYGLSKLTAEKYLQLAALLYEIPSTILRYANVYGPRQNAAGEGGVTAIFAKAFVCGTAPIIFGDGHQTRDFIFVEDVARANLAALENGTGEVLNVSTGVETSINELFERMQTIQSSSLKPIYLAERQGDIKRSVLCNKKTKTVLQWTPHTSLEEGLAKTLEYYQRRK
ncbi:NAD-dependent epimerase/dehydratase family protein [Neobacillus sp. SM06]|uniref:NAD-dependent epimerase/dehydratase family protein n=1 Tax=Neobacillus sp. SM06 TaxID=3422492 RepID=UPI003D2BDD72